MGVTIRHRGTNPDYMNFLFLNSARNGWGGNERSIALVSGILSKKHEVFLAYRSEEVGTHFDIRKFRLPFLFEGDIYTITQLVSIVRKHRIDVIIPSKRKDYALAGIVSRLTGTANIIWLGALRQLNDTPVNRLVYRTLADGIIVNAKQIKDGLLNSGFLKDRLIKVLYRGIDSDALDRIPLNPARENGGKRLTITAMGRLDKNKSHELLIRGFARFLQMQEGIDASLHILGEGAERGNLEQLISELGIENHVRLEGFIEDPYPMLARSDIFVMTSESEGISIALLEAMYLGNAPVSTFAGGGVTEIVTDGVNGFLFEHGDVDRLAEILFRLYHEPELRKKVAAAARSSVASRYASSVVEHDLVTFCNSIITTKAR